MPWSRWPATTKTTKHLLRSIEVNHCRWSSPERSPKEGPLADGIRQALQQREVLHCAPPIEYPEHFPASEYAVNHGLALASRATVKRGIFGFKAVYTNLLTRALPSQASACNPCRHIHGASGFRGCRLYRRRSGGRQGVGSRYADHSCGARREAYTGSAACGP